VYGFLGVSAEKIILKVSTTIFAPNRLLLVENSPLEKEEREEGGILIKKTF
jgi:hypothetical protein